MLTKGRIGSATALCAAGLLLWAGSATGWQDRAAQQPTGPQEAPGLRERLVGQLLENVERQEQLIREQELLAQRGVTVGATGLIHATRMHAEAVELLARVSGEHRDQLVASHEQLVALLDRRMAQMQREVEAGIATYADIAALSHDLARARVKLFEIRGQ